jgi:capsular polysaccharide transport system permease protein
VTDLHDIKEWMRLGDWHSARLKLRDMGAETVGADPVLAGLSGLCYIMVLSYDMGWTGISRAAKAAASPDLSVPEQLQAVLGPLERWLPPEAIRLVRLRVADNLLNTSRNEEAEQWIAAALAADSGDLWARYLNVQLRYQFAPQLRLAEEMEAVAEQVVAEGTDDTEVIHYGKAGLWHRLGLIWLRMAEAERAIECMQRAVTLDPARGALRCDLASSLIAASRPGEAMLQLDGVEASDREYPHAMSLRGVCMMEMGDLDEALRLLGEAVALDPLNARGYLYLGRVHLAKGQLVDAEVALATALRISPALHGLKQSITDLEVQLHRAMDGDAGLPQTTDFEIPLEFQPRIDDPKLFEPGGFFRGVKSHLRIVRAIAQRELIDKYAEHTGGYLWALLEPLIYVGSLDLLYHVAGVHEGGSNVSLEAFLATGIVPLLCFFLHVETTCGRAISANTNLLYFREVTPLSLVFGYFIIEYLTGLSIFVLMTVVLYVFGLTTEMRDPLMVLEALTMMALLGMVFGTLLGMAELVMPSVRFFRMGFVRFIFFTSGIFYYANDLPPKVRTMALYNPILHLVEFVRTGYFMTYQTHSANWYYPGAFIVIGILMVLVADRSTRRFVRAS